MPKVFLSFLGNAQYIDCVYYDENSQKESGVVSFVQEAFLNLYCREWTEQDRIHIFLTQDAEAKNWASLKEKIEALGIKAQNLPIKQMPEGYNTEQFWRIFSIINETIQDGDEIYLDVTNAFRSIPIFVSVLLDYVKLLKSNIKIAKITYGAFEKLGPAYLLKELPPSDRKAPMIDVVSLVELQSWTTAARAFLNSGDADLLADMMPLHRKELGDNLMVFTQSILTCRGSDLIKKLDIDKLKDDIVSLNRGTGIEAQLSHILRKVEQKLDTFQSQTTLNGFAAVDWCIQNGLIQQGYTFLEETCKSYVIEKVLGLAFIDRDDIREAAKVVLNRVPPSAWNNKVNRTEAFKFQTFVNTNIPDLIRPYRKMTGQGGLRNDINHCGHGSNPKTPQALKNDLEKLYFDIKTVLSS